MSILILEEKETPDSVLEYVVEFRPGWLKSFYVNRPQDLADMNVREFFSQVGFPVAADGAPEPKRAAIANYRYYFDTYKYVDLMTSADSSFDQTESEMEAMTAMDPGADIPTYLLEEYQLKECGWCAERGVKLSKCGGCRSFVYCCSAHQAADWKKKHKYVVIL